MDFVAAVTPPHLRLPVVIAALKQRIYVLFDTPTKMSLAGTGDGDMPFVSGVEEALRGTAFIEAAVAASRSSNNWHTFPEAGL